MLQLLQLSPAIELVKLLLFFYNLLYKKNQHIHELKLPGLVITFKM